MLQGKDRMLKALAAVGLLAAIGCSTSNGPAASSESTEAATRQGKARIPDDELRKKGLESIWYSGPDPADTAIQHVTLLSEGLFVATTPVSKSGRLKLIHRENGTPVWYTEIEESLRTGPSVFRYPTGPQRRPDEVYFTQLDTVYCLDYRYGDILWKEQLSFPISTRIGVDENHYFAGSDNGRVFGVKKRSSVEEWTYRTGGAIQGSPAVDPPAVYISSSDGSIYRFAGSTGWTRGLSWKVDTGSRIISDPVVFSRWVLVGSTDYKLYCLEQDGGIFWTFQAEAPIEEAPVVYSYGSNQDFAYVIGVNRTRRTEERTLFSVKLTTGQEVWRRGGVRKVIAMGKKNLYVLEDGDGPEKRDIVALDALGGQEKFRLRATGFQFFPTNHADHGRNAAERGRIYMVATDGSMQLIGERL